MCRSWWRSLRVTPIIMPVEPDIGQHSGHMTVCNAELTDEMAEEMDTFCRVRSKRRRDVRLVPIQSVTNGVVLTALRSVGHSAIRRTRNHQTMISPEVMRELLAVRQVLHYLPESQSTEKGWTSHEQQLFWVALTKFPQGPWTAIAEYIGTKTTRQAMTHAQKLRQKLQRWNTRLRSNPTVSSLMDGVTVTADGHVTVSATSGISPAASAIPAVLPSASHQCNSRVLSGGFPIELESKDHEQHGITASYISTPVEFGQARHGPVPFIFDRHQHPHVPAEHASPDHRALQAAIPHEFVGEVAKSLLESEDGDDDEITDEELKELDGGIDQ